MIAKYENKEKSCQELLDAFFKRFPNPVLQTESNCLLNFMLDHNIPMPGKPGGWAGGFIYGFANRYCFPCGIPGLLNKEAEKFFNVSMSTIYKRAAMIRFGNFV